MLAQIRRRPLPRLAQRNDGFITAAVPQRLVDGIAAVAEIENTPKSEIIRVALDIFLSNYYQTTGNSITEANNNKSGPSNA